MTSNATLSPARPGRGRVAALVVPPLLAMAAIFLLSGQTSDPIDRAWWDVLLRKGAHVTEYAVLTALWWRALRGLGLRFALVTAMAISLGYAATDEFHQTFVDGRKGTPVDVLIDSAGIAIAATVIAVRDYARRRTRGPSRPRAA